MNSGSLNNRITIEKRTIKKIKGVSTEIWDTFYSCWSFVNSLYGSELYKSLEIQQQNVLNFTVRYSKKLDILNTKEYRITWKQHVFNIIAVDFHGFNKEKVTIKASEVI